VNHLGIRTQKSLKLHTTASVVKVDQHQKRIVESPDDLNRVHLKKQDLDWIFNNVKNGVVKVINFQYKDPPLPKLTTNTADAAIGSKKAKS
jgi:hypothetical protein